MDTVNPLFRFVVDRPVVEPEFAKIAIRKPFVRADRAALFDIAENVRKQRALAGIRNDLRHHVATAFKHSEHNRFVIRAAPRLSAASTPSRSRKAT